MAALAGKADVKAHALEKAAHARAMALFKANEARARVQHTAERAADQGFTRPGPAIAGAVVLGAGGPEPSTPVLRRQHGKR